MRKLKHPVKESDGWYRITTNDIIRIKRTDLKHQENDDKK